MRNDAGPVVAADADPVRDWLQPQWVGDAGVTGVGALMSTRAGGVSQGPYASLNLGTAVDDDPAAVAENRRRFADAMRATPVFLRQVHGTRVARLTAVDAAAAARPRPLFIEADASVTDEAGIACTVQVADCLPVLFAAPGGQAVGAAHAGWRGLAGGVLEATLEAVCALAACDPAEVAAWLGPCIGPRAFEVGADVLRGFGLDEPEAQAASPFFKPRADAGGPEPKWLADLAGLARSRLTAAGVVHLSGGEWCTVEDPSRFFSFRRDGSTGRLAAAVWIR